MTEPGKEVARRDLTPKQVRAAVMDAAGMSSDHIAEASGITTKTLASWRSREDYKLEMVKAAGTQLALLEKQVEVLQVEAISAARRAIDKLVAAMEAVDEYDRPYWKIQLDAAIALLSSPAARALLDPKGVGANQGPVTAAAAVVVKISRQDDGSEKVEFGEEVIDVEPREVPEDGGGDA